jgi:hypothetical protein
MNSTNRKSGSAHNCFPLKAIPLLALLATLAFISFPSEHQNLHIETQKEAQRTLSGIQTPAGYVNSSLVIKEGNPFACSLSPSLNTAYLLSDKGIIIINTTDFNKITKQPSFKVDLPKKLVQTANGEIGYLGTDSEYGFIILDLSQVPNKGLPVIVSNLTLKGINSLDVSSDETLVYITDEDSGLRILNVSNILDPREIISTGLDRSGLSLVTGTEMLSDGKTVLATDFSLGLKILNLDDTMIARPISELTIKSPSLL